MRCGVLLRREVAERAVQVLGAVLGPEALEQHAGVRQASELMLVQPLIVPAAVEGLAEAVLPGLSRSTTEAAGAAFLEPVDDLPSDELAPSWLMTARAPCRWNGSASTVVPVRAVIECALWTASARRVNSSTTVSTLSVRPEATASQTIS